MWLSTRTRSDISKAVHALACHSQPYAVPQMDSYDDDGIPSRGQGYEIDMVRGSGLGL